MDFVEYCYFILLFTFIKKRSYIRNKMGGKKKKDDKKVKK